MQSPLLPPPISLSDAPQTASELEAVRAQLVAAHEALATSEAAAVAAAATHQEELRAMQDAAEGSASSAAAASAAAAAMQSELLAGTLLQLEQLTLERRTDDERMQWCALLVQHVCALAVQPQLCTPGKLATHMCGVASCKTQQCVPPGEHSHGIFTYASRLAVSCRICPLLAEQLSAHMTQQARLWHVRRRSWRSRTLRASDCKALHRRA
jgi:hypothetical protein